MRKAIIIIFISAIIMSNSIVSMAKTPERPTRREFMIYGGLEYNISKLKPSETTNENIKKVMMRIAGEREMSYDDVKRIYDKCATWEEAQD